MKSFFLFVVALAFLGCSKDCEQTATNLVGDWHSLNYSLHISEQTARICDNGGFCCETSYYYNVDTKTLYFCANMWLVEFDCKTLTATDEKGEVITFE